MSEFEIADAQQPHASPQVDSALPTPSNISTAHNVPDKAMQTALKQLDQFLKPYLPLHRQPGRQVFEGMELVDHEQEGKPFNDLGRIVMAIELLKSWEQHADHKLKERIDYLGQLQLKSETIGKSRKQATVKQLAKATQPHQSPSQPLAYALMLPKKERKFEKFVVVGGGMIFIREKYIRRIELENNVYRRHLDTLEHDLNLKVARDIEQHLISGKGFSNGASTKNTQKHYVAPKPAKQQSKVPTSPTKKLQDSQKRKADNALAVQKKIKKPKVKVAEDGSFYLTEQSRATSGKSSNSEAEHKVGYANQGNLKKAGQPPQKEPVTIDLTSGSGDDNASNAG